MQASITAQTTLSFSRGRADSFSRADFFDGKANAESAPAQGMSFFAFSCRFGGGHAQALESWVAGAPRMGVTGMTASSFSERLPYLVRNGSGITVTAEAKDRVCRNLEWGCWLMTFEDPTGRLTYIDITSAWFLAMNTGTTDSIVSPLTDSVQWVQIGADDPSLDNWTGLAVATGLIVARDQEHDRVAGESGWALPINECHAVLL